MVAKATFLIEPLVAARMALEWIQGHGSKRHFSWSLERELVYAGAKATFLMVLLAANNRRRRFSWLKTTILMVAKATLC